MTQLGGSSGGRRRPDAGSAGSEETESPSRSRGRARCGPRDDRTPTVTLDVRGATCRRTEQHPVCDPPHEVTSGGLRRSSVTDDASAPFGLKCATTRTANRPPPPPASSATPGPTSATRAPSSDSGHRWFGHCRARRGAVPGAEAPPPRDWHVRTELPARRAPIADQTAEPLVAAGTRTRRTRLGRAATGARSACNGRIAQRLERAQSRVAPHPSVTTGKYSSQSYGPAKRFWTP